MKEAKTEATVLYYLKSEVTHHDSRPLCHGHSDRLWYMWEGRPRDEYQASRDNTGAILEAATADAANETCRFPLSYVPNTAAVNLFACFPLHTCDSGGR